MTTSILHVLAATSEYVDLSASIVLTPIDGVILTVNDRVLVKSQGSGEARIQNGIYYVDGTNHLVRATGDDGMASGSAQTVNQIVFVAKGALYSGSAWCLLADANSSGTTVTIGTDPIEFRQFSVQTNILENEIPNSVILRSTKGSALSNDELDNNTKFLAYGLSKKLNTGLFTAESIVAKINAMDVIESQLNALTLDSMEADSEATIDTIVARTHTNEIKATTFVGDLTGTATEAVNAVNAINATNITGITEIVNGGTGVDNAKDARIALGVIGVAGVDDIAQMSGKLRFMDGTVSNAPINLGVGVDPNAPTNGDFWTTTTDLKFRLDNTTATVAKLFSPQFSGAPTVPNANVDDNSATIANTKFVQDNRAAIEASLTSKANLASPILTGTPMSPTMEVATIGNNIASTEFVKNYVETNVPQLPALTGKVNKSGATMTGSLYLSVHPTEGSSDYIAATKYYVDRAVLKVSSGTCVLTNTSTPYDVYPPDGLSMGGFKGIILSSGTYTILSDRISIYSTGESAIHWLATWQ